MNQKIIPKILIVDDKHENIISMQLVLKEIQAEIHSCASGNEALSLMLRNKYAVVLIDVVMPEMNGFELVTLMRDNPETVLTPVIFVTAEGLGEVNIFHGYEVGAIDYLLKPLDKMILIAKVKIFIELFLQTSVLENSLNCYKNEL